MFKCNKCGSEFAEPNRWEEKEYHSEVDAHEHFECEGCPECGSQDIDEWDECVVCDEGAATDGVLCDTCGDEIYNKIAAFFMGLKDDYKILDGDVEDIINYYWER